MLNKNTKPIVDFHLLKQADNCNFYLVKILEEALNAGRKVLIATPSIETSFAIDHYLWTYRQNSFLPHLIIEEHGYDSPILISHHEIPTSHLQVLLNFKDEVIENYRYCEKIIEFVLSDEKAKERSRIKYKDYQQLGYSITLHQSTLLTKEKPHG